MRISYEAKREIQLEPLIMAQILDRAIRLYRNHFLHFAGIIAAVQIIILPFNMAPALAQITTSPVLIALAFSLPILGVFLSLILGALSTAALIWAVTAAYFGEPTTIGGAYGYVQRKLGALIGSFFLLALIGIAMFVWWLVPVVGWFSGFGMITFAGFIFQLIWMAVIVEDLSATESIRRAWDLTRNHFWRIVGFGTILNLIGQLIITGPIVLVSIIPLAMTDPLNPGPWPAILQAMVTTVATVLFTPFTTAAYVFLYFDLRIRQEGLDLAIQNWINDEEMASSTNGDESHVSDGRLGRLKRAIVWAPQLSSDTWLTLREFWNFVLLTLAAVGVMALILGAFFGVALSFIPLIDTLAP